MEATPDNNRNKTARGRTMIIDQRGSSKHMKILEEADNLPYSSVRSNKSASKSL